MWYYCGCGDLNLQNLASVYLLIVNLTKLLSQILSFRIIYSSQASKQEIASKQSSLLSDVHKEAIYLFDIRLKIGSLD